MDGKKAEGVCACSRACVFLCVCVCLAEKRESRVNWYLVAVSSFQLTSNTGSTSSFSF